MFFVLGPAINLRSPAVEQSADACGLRIG